MAGGVVGCHRIILTTPNTGRHTDIRTEFITFFSIITTTGLTTSARDPMVRLILLLQKLVIPTSTLLSLLALLLTSTTRTVTAGKILRPRRVRSTTLLARILPWVLLIVLETIRPLVALCITLKDARTGILVPESELKA